MKPIALLAPFLLAASWMPNGQVVAGVATQATPAETATLRLSLTDQAERASITYETPRNYILFSAAINGHPATFLLDNGADRTLIDQGFAQRSGIGSRPTEHRWVTSAFTRVAAATTDEVTLEAARTFRVTGPMVAIDLRPIATGLGRPVDAVLGSDVLDHFAVTILPDRKRLLFHPGGSAAPTTGTIKVPIADDSIVAAELNGQQVRLKLDLGYNGVVRLSDSAWQRVVPAGSPTRKGSQTTADGTTRETRIVDAALRLGTVRLNGIPLDSGYVPAGPAEGLLGNGFLSRGAIVLDLKGRQLLLLPRQPPAGARAP